ncbi:hypothetical protein NP493_1103g00040 [Ridgeia piscesae]|uniref:alpha-1,2-Mannosidase n=1 Tax=Ridgeia piscesae TaxID=27915 RepID=A0AAD9KIE1_RIDPI|nr:hypothetical protein NP493_1103g00040 [Ridgeia piscesae]
MILKLFSLILGLLVLISGNLHFFKKNWGSYDRKYGNFPESERLEMLEEARKMFQFGYDNYMRHAFPKDELNPIYCTGRGPDYENPSNININDVLGDYALTLVDSLDTLAVMGNTSEFKRAVQLVIEHVSFNKSNTVQVFEVTIRILGGLLSAHLIIRDPLQPFGNVVPPDYDNELLQMAHDLANRLMPAFDCTGTGIPYPRVNLMTGVPKNCLNLTCTSGAGSLMLEFGLLSRLLGDPVYEMVARRAIDRLWTHRSNITGLFGNVIDIHTGEWVGRMSGLGAGIDSFYEYMLKAFILLGNREDLKRFNDSYQTIRFYLRRGRPHCNKGTGYPPIYVNVDMINGEMTNNWIDSLQAAWPGVQVLNGDIEEAICSHALYYAIWQKYGALPERFNWHLKTPEVSFYPLRPELIESTYLLYRATHNPFYLHVGRNILRSLNNHTKVKCGYATIHDVQRKDLEDRMESFFLSETCKYLYLLFDHSNHVNKDAVRYLFTTEGHLIPISRQLTQQPWLDDINTESTVEDFKSKRTENDNPVTYGHTHNSTGSCGHIPKERRFFLPIESRYLQQLESLIGVI